MTTATEKGEQVSAFIDDELTHDNCQQLISTLNKDEALKSCLERYQIISDSMRNQLPSVIKWGFAHRIMSAIESEPVILAPTTRFSSKPSYQSSITRKVAGFAIAASVATIAVVAVQSQYSEEPAQLATTMPDNSEFVRIAKENPISTNMQPVITPNPSSGYSTASATVQQQPNSQVTELRKFDAQLQQYIVNHSQYTAGAGVHDIISSARIASSSQQKITMDQVKQ